MSSAFRAPYTGEKEINRDLATEIAVAALPSGVESRPVLRVDTGFRPEGLCVSHFPSRKRVPRYLPVRGNVMNSMEQANLVDGVGVLPVFNYIDLSSP